MPTYLLAAHKTEVWSNRQIKQYTRCKGGSVANILSGDKSCCFDTSLWSSSCDCEITDANQFLVTSSCQFVLTSATCYVAIDMLIKYRQNRAYVSFKTHAFHGTHYQDTNFSASICIL